MVIYVTTVYADGHDEAEQGIKSETVSLEFLEFIADWETTQGDWMGPENFEEDSFDQLYEVDENEE
jgi:hypothetical protein